MDLTVTENEFFTDNRTWLRSEHGFDNAHECTLASDLFTGALGLNDGFVKSGTVLARMTGGAHVGKYGPYTNAGANGQGTPVGFLKTGVRIAAGRSVGAAILRHCIVVEANLPHTGSPGGIDASARTALADQQITFV